MTWHAKEIGIDVLLIIFGTVIVVGIFEFPELYAPLNLLALIATLIVLIWYAYDTHRMANQTVESALRPVILRQGKILDWKVNSTSDIQSNGFTLEFLNQKNIVKDISGHIIIQHKKYKLHFGNEITEEAITENGKEVGKKIILFEKWGWLPIGGAIHASYDNNKFEKTNKDNEIYLEYQDIESNRYFTKEDKDFCQSSGKL
ncbi:MAG: hypothetical protein A3C02_00835 [Candidatus Andersenbacteria bacterium RIFCSPHIGHO2_02_FULL_45_11]|uniref:Uncharacterized protein n=1 Tax=Candidatus Andersenbacteria bacterium RIFCSPHIGHO2_12_FULL_45_11 TaxID=1797281 RepID=A0A1G1X3U2_9BACT|nr:MAG: hypothetical protein A2805_01590 [Candidatus Andersenbacteria bacterium RIFCSPHIGHO2_01_FULL_46_36]OGY33328.1 MAG: hypothetical protein A3C02_00835 [Candidatus Andersenbacteria bacterium RIFCSPHIGHO2_02_FULL_45_11]OGY34682.1 MAG: hypothetical protein A3D99_05080 [Candidatus Andersenbacteria bacterium RIFCSPHIGHO2_12_FULL_45_11]